MSVTPRGFEDLALDKMVTLASAYVTAQKADYLVEHPTATPGQIAAAVGFTVERDRRTPPTESDLKREALVNMGFDSESSAAWSPKQSKHATAVFFIDCYAAAGETADGLKVGGDKRARLRLMYLKAQTEAALFALAEYHLGFGIGVIAKKPFMRWQDMSGTEDGGERWVVAGRWTLELDYEWAPLSPQGVALEEISVDAGLWSGLYEYEEPAP